MRKKGEVRKISKKFEKKKLKSVSTKNENVLKINEH